MANLLERAAHSGYHNYVLCIMSICFCFVLGFTSRSTIFQSFEDGFLGLTSTKQLVYF